MSKRPNRKGTITKLRNGRFWVRAPRNPLTKQRRSLGVVASLEEAERLLTAASSGPVRAGRGDLISYVEFARVILDERELDGVRAIESERSRFATDIEHAEWAQKPLNRITIVDGATWLRGISRRNAFIARGKKRETTDRKVARSTIQRALTLANTIFEEAGPNGRMLIKTNPFRELRVRRRPGDEATRETWTFLLPAEQEWFSRPRVTSNGYVKEEERLLTLFSAGCGARQGEQLHLHLDDVHLDVTEPCTHAACPMGATPHAVLRFGSEGLPRKNNRILYIPLFGYALTAITEWLRLRARLELPGTVVFPRSTGKPRSCGKPLGNGHFKPVGAGNGTHVYPARGKQPIRVGRGKGTHAFVDRWHEVRTIAGIQRPVRWHDLRHTTGTALVQGHWGEAWTLAEVKEQLGHSSQAVTERYAHLGPTILLRAAKKIQVG